MTLVELAAHVTALAPQGITSVFSGSGNCVWKFADKDGDGMEITVYPNKDIIMIADSGCEVWQFPADVLMWLGMLGGMVQELLQF